MSSESGLQERLSDAGAGEAAARALGVVSQELMETIRSAHLALEDCVDGRGGSAALAKCRDFLHQVRGVLRMTETYGAALLAEEMEAACDFLARLRPDTSREDGLDALTRAMVQLPNYIERLLGGGRDIALVLLPMLNDLRAVRGKPLLSEGTLLLLNLSPSRKAADTDPRKPSGEDPVAAAKRLRPRFQLALLGWIKGGNSVRHLQTLSGVVEALEKASNRDDMYQLWWVLGGVLESLQNGGLETSVSLKRLLGQADRQIKKLIDDGPDTFAQKPVTDLLNNLLYYVARSGNAGPRISEIRAAFNLSELLPGDEQVEYARENLSAPSVKLMKTVAAAIKEDLGRVKDVLDIYVRTGMNKSSELVPQLDLLKKISDTLGVLGLGELRGDIDTEVDRLKAVVRDGGASEQTILEIASTLLRVEDRLDQQLTRLIVPRDLQPDGAEQELPPEEDADYRQVAEAVMRESIINLARIKETFSQSLANGGDSHGVDSVPGLIRGIKAGLLMLNKPQAMDVFDRVGELILLALRGGGPARLQQKETDRLADAIVSIEYYMETVKAGRREPSYMLDNAESCLLVLNDLAARLRAEKKAAPGLTEAPPPAEMPAAEASTMQSTAVMDTPVVAADAEHLDPELLELFIEESKEEITSINRHVPQWIDNPDDMETLITVRRSFHTLKGSGRMVGAERIGEYCWAIEGLLNKLINRTLTRTPPMLDFISKAAAIVPELVEQLEVGTEPRSDIALFMARANAFADGDPNASVLTIGTIEPTLLVATPALEMDPVLLDIFAKETAGHLQAIRDYLDSCERHRAPFNVTDKLHRSCHTLHGSANMANVDRGVAVAGALNRYVRRVYDYQVGFDDNGIRLLREAAAAIENIVADINQPERERLDYSELIEQLVAKTNAVEPEVPDEQPAAEEQQAGPEPAFEPEPVAAEVAPEPDGIDGDYDAEIAAIFSEEAAELLEAADQAFSAWSRDRDARAHVEELKRHLHTLKGGARMAGIGPMGNLSHELETLLIGIDEGRVKPSGALDQLLQQSIDELHRMRDSVIAGRKVSAAVQLEERVRLVCSGGDAERLSVAGPLPGEFEHDDAAPVEFTAEPEDRVSMIIVDESQPSGTPESEPGDAPAEQEAFTGSAADSIDWQLPADEEPLPPEFEIGELTDGDNLDLHLEANGDVDLEEFIGLPVDGDGIGVDDAAITPPGDTGSLPASARSGQQPGEVPAPPGFQEREESPETAGQEQPPEIDEPEQPPDIEEPEQPPEIEEPEQPPEIEEPEQPPEIEEPGQPPEIEEPGQPPEIEEPGQPPEIEEPQEPPELQESREPQRRLMQVQKPPDGVAELRAVGGRGSGEGRQEFARIDAELLEDLLNAAGEISIYHSRLSAQVNSIEFHLEEFAQTVIRLREQLRKLEIETEAQIMNRHHDTLTAKDFDPLEMDRYSNIQQLSRSLAESASDMGSLKDLLQNLTAEADTLLVQQSRVTAELQDGLMRTRMVPFQRHVPRLTRLVRQAAQESGKRAELAVEGASGELDRQVLDKMLPPFEHMMRNAVVHGIESPEARQSAGKPASGRITIRLHREGAEMVIDVSDDGAGLNVDAIRRKAFERELLRPDSDLSDAEIMQLILTPGFSTASKVTQSAGRGVGMDVVANEVKQLGGSLQISSVVGQGTNFTIRLPFTLAITQALVVRAGDEVYAMPLPTVEGVARIARAQLSKLLDQSDPTFEYGEQTYRFRHLGMYLGGQAASLPEEDSFVPVILVRAGDYSAALLTDEMIASQEIVVKTVGPQLASIRGISGATILGDGRIVLILDINALIRTGAPAIEVKGAAPARPDERPLAMVVDDSITVRRVMERFLTRSGLRVVTAKDGMDAISVLRDHTPDIILLDIEMPRMDGYEFATHVRNDERISEVPIIMITSRSGDKHRARAIEIGVNDYLGKPYQDTQLLEAIERLLEARGITLS